MTRGDVARLLAYIAAFDRRTLGDADVLAWYDVLGDLDFELARAAVRVWYTERDGWIMPSHIRTAVIGQPGSAVRHPSARPVREVLAGLEVGFDELANRRGLAAARAALANRTLGSEIEAGS